MTRNNLQSYNIEQLEFEGWLESPLGKALMAEMEPLLVEQLNECFGIHQVHVGPGANLSSDLPSPMLLPLVMGVHGGNESQVIMDPHNMPLANDLVQALILQHVFDITQDPHDLLREATRVVMPGGRIIICGFNPMSSWGLWRGFYRSLGLAKGVPWKYRFLFARRLKDWLTLLNFRVVKHNHCFYRFPINNEKWLARTAKMESLGARFCSPFGALYVVVGVKHESRLRSHRPSWLATIRPRNLGLAKVSKSSYKRENNGNG